MSISVALTEYTLTAGILAALAALIIGIVYDRHNIAQELKRSGLKRWHVGVAIAITVAFIAIELYLVKPTQLLFFDDAIYQGMAQQLIHTGQAVMCNYGTPSSCFMGEIFHEPIGLSFNIAIAFIVLGVKQYATHAAELALAALSVFMTFFVTLLMFRDARAAAFSEMLMALSPVMLVWAMPTNSDMAMLAYSMVALFFVLVFMRNKKLWSASNMLMSLALLSYMKVNALLYLPVFAVMFLLLDGKSIAETLTKTMRLAYKHILDTKALIVVLVFVLVLAPSVLYAGYESAHDNFGAVGTIQNTCANMASVQVAGMENLQNFNANVCANVLFWVNEYSSMYIIQPIIFSALALLGVALLLLLGRWREVAAIAVWFAAFFLLYTAFYAGAVIYGVDWRFMLSLIAQTSILGGVGIAAALGATASAVKKRWRGVRYIAYGVVLALIAYPMVHAAPLLSIPTSQIIQAPDARFYEGFVYNSSASIPASCLVYTYDPSLFNINGRDAIQLGSIYNTSQYDSLSAKYGCTVLDYGYWCHTPNNLCEHVNDTFNLTPIATAAYPMPGGLNRTYGFYYLNKKSG